MPPSSFDLPPQIPKHSRNAASLSPHRDDNEAAPKDPHYTLTPTRLRQEGWGRLLFCDLRTEPDACLNLLQTAVQGVILMGDAAPGIRPALSRLLALHGIQVFHSKDAPMTQECLQELLKEYDSHRAISPALPTVSEIPDDHEVITALNDGEIRAAWQPKVMINTPATPIYGFEVLARWQRADGHIALPGQFLPALRRTGRLNTLLFSLMEQALTELHAHNLAHLDLAFNLEPSQLAEPELSAQIERLLHRLNTDPQRITFELTETGALQAPAFSLKNLLHLRFLGCNLAIDDFGKGHSTLQRLIELPISELKLDACLLANLDQNPRCGTVLASIIALGNALDIPVVAEGVETEDQFRHLQRLGYERAQGYYFGKPATGNALTCLLHTLSDSTFATKSQAAPHSTTMQPPSQDGD